MRGAEIGDDRIVRASRIEQGTETAGRRGVVAPQPGEQPQRPPLDVILQIDRLGADRVVEIVGDRDRRLGRAVDRKGKIERGDRRAAATDAAETLVAVFEAGQQLVPSRPDADRPARLGLADDVIDLALAAAQAAAQHARRDQRLERVGGVARDVIVGFAIMLVVHALAQRQVRGHLPCPVEASGVAGVEVAVPALARLEIVGQREEVAQHRSRRRLAGRADRVEAAALDEEVEVAGMPAQALHDELLVDGANGVDDALVRDRYVRSALQRIRQVDVAVERRADIGRVAAGQVGDHEIVVSRSLGHDIDQAGQCARCPVKDRRRPFQELDPLDRLRIEAGGEVLNPKAVDRHDRAVTAL